VKPWPSFRGIPDSLRRGPERQSPGHKISTEVATGPKSADKRADSVAKIELRSMPLVGAGEETDMSYRSVLAVAAVVLMGMWLATDAMAQRGGRGGGGRANVGRGNVNVNVNRGVVRRPVAVGAAVAAGAAAGSAYYAECGYFPYPPCGY
jgi:hypothetical protein